MLELEGADLTGTPLDHAICHRFWGRTQSLVGDELILGGADG